MSKEEADIMTGESHIFEALHTLNFEALYGEIAEVVVENLTDTLKVDIDHIEGTFVMHEDLRPDIVFKPI
jgi:hypothetical protein